MIFFIVYSCFPPRGIFCYEDTIFPIKYTPFFAICQYVNKIFNKFYRVESSGQREGNGIGLSIVKHIVELHDGKVFVNSAEGNTEFIVELPV